MPCGKMLSIPQFTFRGSVCPAMVCRLPTAIEVIAVGRWFLGGHPEAAAQKPLQPIVDVAGVVLANLRRDLQVSTEKRGAQLGDQLLESVAFVPPPFPPEVAIEP